MAAIAIPSYMRFRDRALVTQIASNLKTFGTAFQAYSFDNDDNYPPDCHNSLPIGMEDYISAKAFEDATPLGGRYNWEGPDSYPYAGISIFEPEKGMSVIELLDSAIDDGDTDSGNFRVTWNGRPTYIIEEFN